jgi:hypothetical protein
LVLASPVVAHARPLAAGQGDRLSAQTVAPAVSEPYAGVLMGAPQKANWETSASECPKAQTGECADEISAGQFVAWPFIAEHSGTIEAIFAVLATSNNTGAEVGIFANRKYSYAEIKFNGEPTSSGETWTPARFAEYEQEIPPEDPGKLLATSGKVAESAIKTNVWTEFKLEKPVQVVKGEKYWLTNTTFAAPQTNETHIYQHFLHERVSGTEAQPWGNYSNEPTNWATVARPLKELPSPETTKINCEKCNTEGWLQEEPKKFKLVNPNREGQEEGGQTYSYAYGRIEEGPIVVTGAASAVTETTATLNGTVNPNASTVSACTFEYGTSTSYGTTAPCNALPGSGSSAVAVSAAINGLKPRTTYDYRVVATNAIGTAYGVNQTFRTLSPPEKAPQAYDNGRLIGASHTPITGFGQVTLSSEVIGELACANVIAGETWDQVVGTETRGVGEVDGWATYGCTDPTYVQGLEKTDKTAIERKEVACQGGYPGVTIGEGKCFSVFATSELPLETEKVSAEVCATESKKLSECKKASEKRVVTLISILRRRVTSMPWKAELIRGEREGEATNLARVGLHTFGEAGGNVDAQEAKGVCYPKEGEAPANWRAVPSGCVAVTVVLPQIPAEVVFYGSQELSTINGAIRGLFPSSVNFEGAGKLFSSENVGGPKGEARGSLRILGTAGVELITAK